mmetsp:Transcript_2662/g.3772  ORF Transcript_2662/g.3772 Transcript_2662/m.3772 type:complete len:122 (-) Transcript_2662:86-451(-)
MTPCTNMISQYRAKVQFSEPDDNSPALDATNTKRVQEVLGTFLFYGRAIDSTILSTIGTIVTQQAKPTKKTMAAIAQLLNYLSSHPNAVVRFQASEMTLHANSDALYILWPKGRCILLSLQ